MQAPLHVGIIPDGNRRWARRNGVSLDKAYRIGYENLIRIIRSLERKGVRYVTVYALSKDNCTRRSTLELRILRELSKDAFNRLLSDEKVVAGELRVLIIGDYSNFDMEIDVLAREVMKRSRWGSPYTLTLLYCYSGSWEAHTYSSSGLLPPSMIHLPPLDLVIRTGGYNRLSGFLPFLADYAEIYVTETLWPDFTEEELDRILEWFSSRPRNFGR